MMVNGPIILDNDDVFVHGRRVNMSADQTRLLTLFMNYRGYKLTPTDIRDALYADYMKVANVHAYVHRLRRRIGRELIDTCGLNGYCMPVLQDSRLDKKPAPCLTES